MKDFWDSVPDPPCSPKLNVQEQCTFCSQLFAGRGRLPMDRIQWNTYLSRTIVCCLLCTNELYISSLNEPKAAHLSAFKEIILKINWASIFVTIQNYFQMIGHSKRNHSLKSHYFFIEFTFKISWNMPLWLYSLVFKFNCWFSTNH